MFVWLSTALASSSTCPVGRGDFVAVGEHSYSPGLISPLAPIAFYFCNVGFCSGLQRGSSMRIAREF